MLRGACIGRCGILLCSRAWYVSFKRRSIRRQGSGGEYGSTTGGGGHCELPFGWGGLLPLVAGAVEENRDQLGVQDTGIFAALSFRAVYLLREKVGAADKGMMEWRSFRTSSLPGQTRM